MFVENPVRALNLVADGSGSTSCLLDVGKESEELLEESHRTVYLNVSYEVQGFPY
jgi:hypothetical protein